MKTGEDMAEIETIGIISGGGWLGSAIARALLASGRATRDSLTCSYRSAIPADAPDCRWTRDNVELVAASQVVILSLRPGDWLGVGLDLRGRLVISVMAGVPVADIRHRSGATRIARALPNAAAAIGQSYTPFFLASDDPADDGRLTSIFATCGLVDRAESEDHIDYFTAMSGSGEAFPALLAQAMIADAKARDIPPDIAERAGRQVLIGAGRMLEQHGRPPAEVVQGFVDYAGTTAAGINAMRAHGFDEAVRAGLQAAYLKARPG